MNRVSLNLLAGVGLGLAAGPAYGNGLRILSQDGFATARGDAFTATADNASAIYYNPAGITQIPGTELRAGLYNIYLEPTFRQPPGPANTGLTYDINKHFAAVPQIFISHTLKDSPMSVGLGIYAPFGGSISWPDDTGFRTVAESGSVTYLRINPVVAFKLGQYVSIGGGLSAELGADQPGAGLAAAGAPLENFFRFSAGQGWAVGGNFGIMVKPCDELSFGVTMRSKTSFNLDGSTLFEQQIIIPRTQIPASANFPVSADGDVRGVVPADAEVESGVRRGLRGLEQFQHGDGASEQYAAVSTATEYPGAVRLAGELEL